MSAVVVCSIIFILLISLLSYAICVRKIGGNNHSRDIINSINIKQDEDHLEEMISFLKENPNIKYNMNAGRRQR